MYSVVPSLLAISGVLLSLSLTSFGTCVGLSFLVPAILAVGIANTDIASKGGFVIICMVSMTTILGFVIAVEIVAYMDELPLGPEALQRTNQRIVQYNSTVWTSGIKTGSILAAAGAVSGLTNFFSGWALGRLGSNLIVALLTSPNSLNKVMSLLVSVAFTSIIGFVIAQVLLSQIKL